METDDLPRYDIRYTDTAIQDILEKAEYITECLLDTPLAMKWYARLRSEITAALSTMPYKYPLYSGSGSCSKGIRLFLTGSDIILYSVDEDKQIVYIRNAFTKGKDIAAYLTD